MKQVLVAYYSQTGNTEKVARAIYDALQCEKEIQAISETVDLQGYALIFCGFPIQAHSVPVKAQNFLKKTSHRSEGRVLYDSWRLKRRTISEAGT